MAYAGTVTAAPWLVGHREVQAGIGIPCAARAMPWPPTAMRPSSRPAWSPTLWLTLCVPKALSTSCDR